MTPAHATGTTRRRCIGIVAAVSAAAAAPGLLHRAEAGAVTPPVTTWQGVALGADAQPRIVHPGRQLAEQLVPQAVAEVQRPEQVFSLYRGDSALVRLKDAGILRDAQGDLTRLLATTLQFCAATGGAFDPTVQPLWELYASAIGAGRPIPRGRSLQAVLARVDWRDVHLDGGDIRLGRPGMRLTLNGIAQGYITDRVTDALRDAGLDHVLVDMGGVRALAPPQAKPWRVGLAGDDEARTPLETLALRAGAVSTSSVSGTVLDARSGLNHIFDPRTGLSATRWRSVSVQAASATTADALSTAFCLMDAQAIRRVAAREDARVWALAHGASGLRRLA